MRLELATPVVLVLLVVMSGSFAVAGTGGGGEPGTFEEITPALVRG